MKRVIKLFFSYNILKTEEYLNKMAKKGFMLTDVNLISKVFTFEECEPKDLIFKISYENKGIDNVSSSLKNSGWEKAVCKGRWLFQYNENKESEINSYPARESLIKRINYIKEGLYYLVIPYLIIYIPMIFIFVVGFGLDLNALDAFQPDFMPKNMQSIFLIAFILSIFIIVKLNKINKELKMEAGKGILLDSEYEIDMDERYLTKKIKLGWHYRPDKMQKWLEDMSLKGYQLCKVRGAGTSFYFHKRESKKVSYVLDYQNVQGNDSYFEIYKSDGWVLNFKGYGSFMKWCIWSKEYEDEKPTIYTDEVEIIKQAKKVLISHSFTLLPIVLMHIYLMFMDFSLINKGLMEVDTFSLFIRMVLIVEFSYFYKDILLYYIRIKKKLAS